MPQRNTVKHYLEGGIYHVYNRGVDKRIIFVDDQDYRVFLHLLKYYLGPQNMTHPLGGLSTGVILRPRPLAWLGQEVELLAYCLMPNHFHLLVRQVTKDGMAKLLRRIMTTYVMYFNRRHLREGHLFQGVYKAARVISDEYLLHISLYIHLNPLELGVTRMNLVSYPYSSYGYYLGLKNAVWVKPDAVLKSVKSPVSYKEFVESYDKDSGKILGDMVID